LAAEELAGYLLFVFFAAFVVAAVTFAVTVLIVRLRGASLDRKLRLIGWGRSAALLLGLCALGLLIVAGWPYLAGGGVR